MEKDRGSEVAGVMMRLTLVTDDHDDQALAEALAEVHDLIAQASADLGP